MIPGEIATLPGDIELNAGRASLHVRADNGRSRTASPGMSAHAHGISGHGGNLAHSSVTFVSRAALAAGIGARLGLARRLVAVAGTRRDLSKKSMIHNDLLPQIAVDPETYEVRAAGVLLTCEPARELALAQRYFLF